MVHIFIQKQFPQSFTLLFDSRFANSRTARAHAQKTCSYFFAHKYHYICCVRYTLKLSSRPTAAVASAIITKKEIIYADFNYIFAWHAIYYAIKNEKHQKQSREHHQQRAALATMMLMAIGFVRSFEFQALKIYLLRARVCVGASKQEIRDQCQ